MKFGIFKYNKFQRSLNDLQFVERFQFMKPSKAAIPKISN